MQYLRLKILLFLTIALIATVYYFSNYNNNNRKISDINIHINPIDNLYITKDSIKSTVENMFDFNKKTSRLKNIESDLNLISYIESAEVHFSVGGNLNLSIVQREPIARIITNDSMFYIDKNLKYISLSKLFSPNIPVIIGSNWSKNKQHLIKALHLIKKDNFLYDNVTQIFFDDFNNLKLKLKKYNSEIIVGGANNIEKKFNNLKAFMVREKSKKLNYEYKYISLQFENQVVAVK